MSAVTAQIRASLSSRGDTRELVHTHASWIRADSYFARGAYSHAACTYVRATPVTGGVFVYGRAR